MKCALVNQATNIVDNVVIADPAVDPAPPGQLLIGLPDGSLVAVGWIYNPETGEFTNPNPPVPPDPGDG